LGSPFEQLLDELVEHGVSCCGERYSTRSSIGLVTRQSARTPEEHLRRADRVLRTVMDEVVSDGNPPPRLPPDPKPAPDPNMPTDDYGVIVRAIVSQNISEIASGAIWGRLIDRFGGRPPAPQEILDADPDDLREPVGLSRAKVTTFRSLADCILTGRLQLDRLHELSDEDVIAQLSLVKGIGTWTAEMFLMFHLYRPDVLPVGDVGLRRAVERAYGLETAPGPADLERIAAPWRPYRTLACIYLWRTVEDTPPL
jgi:DNA-3-methyladenine glycosylase II